MEGSRCRSSEEEETATLGVRWMDKFSTFPFLFYEILAYVHDIFFSFCVDSVERLACSIIIRTNFISYKSCNFSNYGKKEYIIHPTY